MDQFEMDLRDQIAQAIAGDQHSVIEGMVDAEVHDIHRWAAERVLDVLKAREDVQLSAVSAGVAGTFSGEAWSRNTAVIAEAINRWPGDGTAEYRGGRP